MTRVGFVLTDTNWIGGINYYRNLISAIYMIPGREIEPVIFLGKKVSPQMLEAFKEFNVVQSVFLDSNNFFGFFRRVFSFLCFRRDFILKFLLDNNCIDVISHSVCLWPGCKIKSICWIPDFQHVHLPNFFDESDLLKRDIYFKRLIKNADCIVLSSKSAQDDLKNFAPASLEKSCVLHFVPNIDVSSVASIESLEAKYSFSGSFFYLPNQFWAHKNHAIVIDAIANLREAGLSVKVLATGNTTDYRNPNHFKGITDKLRALKLEDSFKILGVVPYSDLISLMFHAKALINPSLFEGWSSTVEEGKLLKKIIILSDFEVHREQAPSKGLYFNPYSAESLADAMRTVMNNYESAASYNYDAMVSEMRKKMVDFGISYQKIVRSV